MGINCKNYHKNKYKDKKKHTRKMCTISQVLFKNS